MKVHQPTFGDVNQPGSIWSAVEIAKREHKSMMRYKQCDNVQQFFHKAVMVDCEERLVGGFTSWDSFFFGVQTIAKEGCCCIQVFLN